MARSKKVQLHRPIIEVVTQTPMKARIELLKNWNRLHLISKITLTINIGGEKYKVGKMYLITWPQLIFKKGDPQ